MKWLWKCARISVPVVLMYLPFLATAQSNRGSITGTVTDVSGGVIPNATAQAREVNTGTTYTTTTTDAGDYTFPQLLVGTYNVKVTAPGFKTANRTGVVVQINTPTVLNVQLALGTAAETVTVVANAPTVQSTTSDIGGVVTTRQVEQLPLSLGGVGAFRSPEAFEFLLPGVTGPGTANNSNGIYIQKTSGGENFGDNVLLDGASAQRPDNGSTFDETAPSVDALSEFRVETATPPAQYGRTAGGVRSFTTHSGTNNFHGSAYDILRNADLDANTYFNDLDEDTCATAGCRSQYATPEDTKNDYGLTFGGPVLIPHIYNGKNKTFFFFAWEQLRWPRSSVVTSTVPTTLESQGNFSQILTGNVIGSNPCTGAPVYAGQIFNPQSETTSANGTPCRTAPFAGNIVPASQISPVAMKALSYVPPPNELGLVNNLNFSSHFPTTNTTYTVRIDQNIGYSDKLFASYDTRENTLLTGGLPQLPSIVDPATWDQDFVTHYGRVGWDHTFSGSLLNHVTLGYNRTNSRNVSGAVNAGMDWPNQLGLVGVSGPTFPQFNINDGFDTIGQARGDDDIANEAEAADNLSWSKGKHTVTFGGEYSWIQYNNEAFDNDTGVYNFSNNETAAGEGVLSSQGGYSLSSFLLGDVDSANLNVFAHYPQYVQHYYALFVQDNYRVTQRLTLNLGLRWSVYTPRQERDNYTSNFDPSIPNPGAGGIPGALIFASNCNGCNGEWAKTFYDDVGPRIGFAYSPGRRNTTAIRGGFGILYGPLFYSDFANGMNAGYAATPNPSSPNGFTPAFNLNAGFPAYTAPPTLNPSILNGQSIDYITPGFGKPPMIITWSFQVQQQLAQDLILSVGYVGNKGQNLRSAAADGMYNNFPLQDLALGQNVLNSNVGSPLANAAGIVAPYTGFTGAVGNALRQYPQYLRFNTDCCLENDGMSTFEALEVMLSRRFRDGLNLQLSYTWSKTLDDADSLLPGTNAGGGLYQDPYNLHLEKAISSQDIPQALVLSYIYELPFGKGRHFLNRGGIANVLVGGWQIGAIQRYQSGQPLPFYCASGVTGWDDCFRFDAVPGQSPFNAAKNQPGFNPLTTPYLNNNYFVDPNPNPNAPIQFGQLARVTGFRMQPYFNEDVNLAKTFKFTETTNLEVRADAFNIGNRHVFAEPYNLGPQPGFAATNFGYVNGTVDTPRSVQLEMRLVF